MGDEDKGLTIYNQSTGEMVSVAQAKAQADRITEIMRAVMKEDMHFGTIPGTKKPSLWKPGAEKIGMVFHFVPEYEIERHDLDNEHREYEVKCILKIRGTDTKVGEGVATCSTMESKYRYRWDNTGAPVPKDYWDTRDPEILGGFSYTARKAWKDNKQSWFIFQRIAHTDPADYWNTCKKIAKKRAYIDAVITTTSCADLFDQDTMEEDGSVVASGDKKKEDKKKSVKSPKAKSSKKDATEAGKSSPGVGDEGVLQWSGKVVRIDLDGEGENWKRFCITCEQGMKFTTIREEDVDLANSAHKDGLKVLIHYEKNEQYKQNQIKSFELAE